MSDFNLLFRQAIQVLPLSLAIIGGISFMLASYFEKPRTLFRVVGVTTLVLSSFSGFGNYWFPQVEGGRFIEEAKLVMSEATTQQIADEGEKIIFGGIGQSKVQGAIGRGMCPLCHSFEGNPVAERAPDLRGVTDRAPNRLKDSRYHFGKPNERDTVQHEAFPGSGSATTILEYLAESDVCHSCYVVAGYGMRGTHDTDSGAPSSLNSPMSLSINDVVAITTWIYTNDGKKPPAPHEIEDAYKKFVPESKWKSVTQTSIGETDPHPALLLADGTESVDTIFSRAQCVACHIIPGIPGAVGTIGPKLTMKTIGPSRIKDKNYHGKARTIREYVTESILYPSIYVPKGTVDNTMPKVFGTKLSGVAIDKMVDYLAQVEEDKAPPPIK
jgi:cytochrome c2